MIRLEWIGRRRAGILALVAGLAAWLPLGHDSLAYVATGDRIFVATGIVPQIAPTDQFYTWAWTMPFAGGPVGAPDRGTNVGSVYEKLITERLGVHLAESWFRIDRVGSGSLYGFSNFESELKYLAVSDHDREFLLTLGVNREWGGTGARQIGMPRKGATEPRVYFGKGWGDTTSAICGHSRFPGSSAIKRPMASRGPICARAGSSWNTRSPSSVEGA